MTTSVDSVARDRVGAARPEVRSDPQSDAKAWLADSTSKVERAATERVADRVIGSADRFEKDVPTASALPAEKAGLTAAQDRLHRDLTAKMATGDWRANPDTARVRSQEIQAAAEKMPENLRTDFVKDVSAPVNAFVAEGMTDPDTGKVSTTRVDVAKAFAPMLDGRSVDRLATDMRQAAPEGQRAIGGALHTIATNHGDPSVAGSAARSLIAGPADVVKAGLAGDIPGVDASSLAKLSDRYGGLAHDQRLLGLSTGLDPSAGEALKREGIEPVEAPPGGVPEELHTALDAAGLTPGVGIFADGANAILYGAQGRVGDAILSAGGAIPAIGQGITGARLAKKGRRRQRRCGRATRAHHRKAGRPPLQGERQARTGCPSGRLRFARACKRPDGARWFRAGEDRQRRRDAAHRRGQEEQGDRDLRPYPRK